MALMEANQRLLVATRRPARLVVLDSASGKMIAELECAGDADDLFYDAEKKLVYVSCGEGVIDVFAQRDPDHYQEVVRIPTAPGARTALWVQELNQLFLAVPPGEDNRPLYSFISEINELPPSSRFCPLNMEVFRK